MNENERDAGLLHVIADEIRSGKIGASSPVLLDVIADRITTLESADLPLYVIDSVLTRMREPMTLADARVAREELMSYTVNRQKRLAQQRSAAPSVDRVTPREMTE